MKRIPLADFTAEKGQTKAAVLLGMTQGSVNKALRVGRDVHVICHDDGTYTAEEVKPFPSQTPSKKSA